MNNWLIIIAAIYYFYSRINSRIAKWISIFEIIVIKCYALNNNNVIIIYVIKSKKSKLKVMDMQKRELIPEKIIFHRFFSRRILKNEL